MKCQTVFHSSAPSIWCLFHPESWGLQWWSWLWNTSPHWYPSAGMGAFRMVFWVVFACNYQLLVPFPMPKDGVDKDSGMVLWNIAFPPFPLVCFAEEFVSIWYTGMLPAIFCLQNRCSKKSFSSAAVPALGLAEPTAPPCVATGLRPPLLRGALSISKPVTTRFGGCWWWWGCFCVGWILEWTCSAWLLVGSTVWRWKALDSYLLSCAASLLASWCLR